MWGHGPTVHRLIGEGREILFIVYSLELQFKIPFSYEISDQSSFTFGGRQRHVTPYIIIQPCVDAILLGIAPFKASTGYDEVFYGYLNDQRISFNNCTVP